jgi:hypothetical protein
MLPLCRETFRSDFIKEEKWSGTLSLHVIEAVDVLVDKRARLTIPVALGDIFHRCSTQKDENIVNQRDGGRKGIRKATHVVRIVAAVTKKGLFRT